MNHKNGVAQQISDASPVGSGVFSAIGIIPAVYEWSDGTPTPAFSATTGLLVSGEGNGFEFTVPADTTKKLLRVHVNAYSARILFEARLSDGSAVPLFDAGFDTTANQQSPVRVFIVAFAAASTGQTLTVRGSLLTDEGGGWLSLQAVTLQAMPAQSGILGGGYTVLAVASTVDLTEEGRIDWTHWGLNSPSDVDRKAGGTNTLGDFSVIGLTTSGSPLQVQQFDDNFTGYSWTDGTPTPAEENSGTGVYLGQLGNVAGPGLNSGFTFSMPADTSIRALKVYVGAYGCRMHFEAALSDGSAPAFVDESFVNPSDGPNRVYTLTFAAASPGQKLVVRWWIVTLIDPGGNVTLQSAVVREAAPTVSLQTPANGSIFYSAKDGLRFTASTIAPFSIASGQLGLELNGAVVSSSLLVTGTPTARAATYTNLEPNQFYQGHIWAVDNLGHAATNSVRFDTFGTNGVVVIEAEDYNYDGGHFIDNPVPGAYTNLAGLFDIDQFNFSSFAPEYRPSDPVGIDLAPETRPYFIEAGVNNYMVEGWNVGGWLNYTRTFPDSEYLVYFRYGALAGQTLELSLVTSDPAQSGQSIAPLGVWRVPRTPNENAYAYAVLTDAADNIITLPLSGARTLRLTGTEVTANVRLQADFLMLVPAPPRYPLSIVALEGQVTISFPTRTGHAYTLQFKNTLNDAVWQNILPAIPGDGNLNSVSQPATLSSRFYRLNVQ